MLDLRLERQLRTESVLALPVWTDGDGGRALATAAGLPDADLAEVEAFLVEAEHTGAAGSVHALPRPTRTPRRLLLVGVGAGDEAAWRAAGATVARQARREPDLAVALPEDAAPAAVRGLAEGLLLAAYRFRLGADDPESSPRLAAVTLVGPDGAEHGHALRLATAMAEATTLARDLTNTPSDRKSPAWLAERAVTAAAGTAHLTAEVWDAERLAADGFGAVLAVGRASATEPRLVQLTWSPPGAEDHVVLVGKGITFDTGGIVIKPRDGMKLMRKDMGGAAAVLATVIGAAAQQLPVRVTALAPMAENAIGADAFRPGDVVRHFDGQTSEIINTDAEGRLVLADTLAYAAARLAPDALVDLATLTGAQSVALGKRTAALFSEDDGLAEAIAAAASAAGEAVWRMPLIDEYRERLDSDVADLANAVESGGAGCVTAALYLREFTGTARPVWAHLDMSAPAWSDSASGELAKGATGWGVRTLLRWLAARADAAVAAAGRPA